MRGIVPMSDRAQIPPVPFLLRPQHRLLVRGAQDDAEFIRQPGVFRIVLVERVVPHRRPEVIALQPENQLEQPRIKQVVVIGHALGDRRIRAGRDRAEFCHDPIGQVWRFVVQEDAAVSDRGRPLHEASRFDEQRLAVNDRHVRPPVPRGHTNLLGQAVDTVDGSPLVAPGDHERALDARQRMGHDLDEKGFPPAGDRSGVELVTVHQSVDERAPAERADDDNIPGGRRNTGGDLRADAGDAFDIGLQVA